MDGKRVIINAGHYWGDNPKTHGDKFKVLGLPDHGTFAEYVYVPQNYIHEAPAHLSNEEAAALPLAGLTSYRALVVRGEAKKNEKVLISGIGGGVALFAFQFALALGMEIYVTSGSPEKIEKAIAMGAKGGANYTEKDWAKNLSEKVGLFDLVIDSAAGKGFNNFMTLIKRGGRIVLYGGTQGKIDGLVPQILFWKQASILGSTMGSEENFADMLKFVNKHKIKPIIDSIYNITEAEKAFKKMEEGKQFGKIVFNHQ